MASAHATASDTQHHLDVDVAELFQQAQADDAALLALSRRFIGWMRFERTPAREIVVMPAAESTENSADGARLLGQLFVWNDQAGEPGVTFGSSGGWSLPEGSVRSPDAAWLSMDRWRAYVDLPDRGPYATFAPEFLVEVMSPRDTRPAAQARMQEWRRNGTLLGWLIDPVRHLAWVYRARESGDPEPLSKPDSLSGEDVLPGFTADLTRIWRNNAATPQD